MEAGNTSWMGRMRKDRLTVTLDKDLGTRLREISQAEGVAISGIIERSLTLYFALLNVKRRGVPSVLNH